MEVVSKSSVLAENAAAHIQDNLSFRRSFSSHCTIIYSPYDLICLDEKGTLNKSTSGIVLREKMSLPPMVIVNYNS